MTTTATPAAGRNDLIESLDDLRHALDDHPQSGVELGRYLLQHEQVTPAQLEKALATKDASPDRRLGEILVEQNALPPEALTMALSHLMGVPSVRLAHLDIDRHVVHRLSPELVHRHHVMPVMLHHQGLVVACATLPDHAALQELSFQAGTFIFPVLASLEDIQAAVFLHYDTFAEDLAAADGRRTAARAHTRRTDPRCAASRHAARGRATHSRAVSDPLVQSRGRRCGDALRHRPLSAQAGAVACTRRGAGGCAGLGYARD